MTLLRFGSSRSSGGIMMHSSESLLTLTLSYKTLSGLIQRHVNNVHYVRFFESGRLKWLTSFAHALGGPSKARDMISARGVGLILKWIDVRYRRPVRFPDTVRPSLSLLASLTSYLPHFIASHSTQAHSCLPQCLLCALTYRIPRSSNSLLVCPTRYSCRLQFNSRLVRL